MAKEYVIGIDSGTSVVKTALFDMKGNEVVVHTRSTPVIEERFGWKEFDMDTDWRETALCLKELMEKANEKGITKDDILALGVGGKGQGVCFLDESMRPIRTNILWHDARTFDMMVKWMEPGGKMEQIHAINGNWLYSGNMAIVLPWLKYNERETLDKAHTFTALTSWLTYQLTGVHKLLRSDMFTLLDGKTREYSDEVFEIIDMQDYRHLFPEPVDPDKPVGTITASAAEQTGLAEGIPVVNMGWDVVCCQSGVGAIKDGQANVIFGTASVISVVMPFTPTTPERSGVVAPHAIPGKWVQAFAPMTGTVAIDWFVQNFTHADQQRAKNEGRSMYEIFDEEISKVPIGSHGVIFHPYLNMVGERSPFINTAARGNFFGLTTLTSRAMMHRALYEGLVFADRHSLESFAYDITEVRLSGGGSKSPILCQMFADICNMPVSKSAGSEYGAKGVAWNAAWVAGAFATQEEACEAFCGIDVTYMPNPESVQKYQEVYEIYTAFQPKMEEAWDMRMDYLKKYGYEG